MLSSRYKDATWDAEFMTMAQINKVRGVSKAKKGPWKTWFPQMCQKVPLRRLSLRVEKSPTPERWERAIEQDATLTGVTIDGTAEENDAEIKQEFSAEKQAEKPVAGKKAAAKSSAAGTDASPGTMSGLAPDRQRQEAGGPAATGSEGGGTREPPPTDPTEQNAGEIWPIDEFGEPVDRPEPMTAEEFGGWFAARIFTTKNANALREHNADNIQEAGRISFKTLGVIESALARHRQREQDERDAARLKEKQDQEALAPKVEEAKVSEVTAPTHAARKPIEVPKTPKGQPHWPNYLPLAKAEIVRLPTEADIDEWITVNQPQYKGKAVEIGIDNTIRDRRASIKAKGGRVETNTDLISRVRREVEALKDMKEFDAWQVGDIRPIIVKLRADDPDAFNLCLSIIDDRRLILEGDVSE